MDTNHRFDVTPVSGDSRVDDNSWMTGLPNNGVPDLGHSYATYPALSSDPKARRTSVVHLTREALPRLDHYLNCIQATKRPSLGEVHGELYEEKVSPFFITTQVSKQRQLKENMIKRSERE